MARTKTLQPIKKYQPKDLESKWQKKWEEDKIFSPDIENSKNPYYSLMMFPYPSAEGLHVGSMFTYSGVDAFSRLKRMQGFDVFEPIGLDGFGIHSENYALKVGKHPMELSKVTEEHFYQQFRMIGNSFDWTRTVETYKPDYYKWTQWLFLQLYKKDLAYRKKAEVNWCPSCKTVLSDEQVIADACERCGTTVEKRMLEQWFFKITDYADRLLNNLNELDWAEKIKVAQHNWIGKKNGINITYQIEGSSEEVVVFTTRPDTNYGATFIVIGPEHPLVEKITQAEHLEEVKKYQQTTASKTDMERIEEGKVKTGVFTGSYAINNLNGKKLPIWVTDFVLGNVGTGAVVGVPGHDLRDFQFAKTFGLEVIRVVVGSDGDESDIRDEKQVQEEQGKMVNSDFLNGVDIHEVTIKIMDYLEEKGWGKRVTSYHLRDWLISRQRYWGPPIPIIYCDKCGTVPVPEEDLPVELPYVENFRPMGTGQSPLAEVESFYKVKCPKCGAEARRETDVSDTFLDSAWYFLRYPSTDIENKAFDTERTKKWLPVDSYIGGAEHAVLHLLYARFTNMVLFDMGLINFEEPFTKFRANGLIIRDGAKMSKSKGNVVNPDEYIAEYGADTLRMHLLFSGVYAEGGDFQEKAVNGIYRFIQRVWKLIDKIEDLELTAEDLTQLNKTVIKVGEDIEDLKFNTAIAALMEWLNYLSRKEKITKIEYKTFLLLLAPFAPHLTEELWQILGEQYSIHKQNWPKFDETKITQSVVKIAIQVNGKVRDILEVQNEKVGDQKLVEELVNKSPKVQKFVNNAKIKKTIYVPGKVLNLVV